MAILNPKIVITSNFNDFLNCSGQTRSSIILFSPGVPAEGTCKRYIVLRRMANYNTRRKLPILPKMV